MPTLCPIDPTGAGPSYLLKRDTTCRTPSSNLSADGNWLGGFGKLNIHPNDTGI